MNSNILALAVQIVRFVDDSFPGWGHLSFWTRRAAFTNFVDKIPDLQH
jgi:hypothetical protein